MSRLVEAIKNCQHFRGFKKYRGSKYDVKCSEFDKARSGGCWVCPKRTSKTNRNADYYRKRYKERKQEILAYKREYYRKNKTVKSKALIFRIRKEVD